jgi:DHA1 family bicyclomycin/chloramphenicol resistance-like MFS transporter
MTVPQKNAASGPLFILILSGLMAFASLSTDIYLPAMPVMAAELQGDAELTITGFLIGFALAQLIWGPVSDRLGRRTPLFIGMVLFIIGSAGCALSDSIDRIIFWRVFQALGACTGPMLARAMVRDLFARTRAAQMLSTLTIVMAIAPIIGPLMGGQMIRVTSWHAIFWLLAGIGLVMLLAAGDAAAGATPAGIVAEGVSSLRAAAAQSHFHALYPESDLLLRRRLRFYYRFAGCLYSLFRR